MDQIKRKDPARRKPLVKSSKQQKRKAAEFNGKENDCGAVPVKKPIAGATEYKKSQVQPQVPQQIPCAKIKLQLFPINDDIRLVLEKDGYNPFLELALSHSKKISSVVRHLDLKWGSSSVATGNLMLFPYTIMSDQIALSPRWTSNDINVTARDVYNTVGNPPVFRLRYAWGSTSQSEKPKILSKTRPLDTHIKSQAMRTDFSEVLEIASLKEKTQYEASDDYQKQIDVNESIPLSVNEPKALDAPKDQVKINMPDLNAANRNSLQENGLLSDLSIGGLLSESSLLRKLCDNDSKSLSHSPFLLSCSDLSIGGFLSDSWLPNKSKAASQPVEGGSNGKIASPWDDSFTCISMGGLFNEASLQAKIDHNNEVKENKSFDAPLNAPQSLSLFDAEETCHAFPILKSQSSNSGHLQFPSISKSEVSGSLDFALPSMNITGSGGWHK